MSSANESSRNVLTPYDRISEVLFGLIMVLTFTGSLSVAESGRADVKMMLIGALGCNVAWGIIDAILYIMGCLSDRGQGIRALRSLQRAGTPEEAHGIIAGVLPPLVAQALDPADYESLRKKLSTLPAPPARPSLTSEEWRGAGAVFLWVIFTTFPVAIPFIFMHDIGPALRASNAVAIVMLFITGFAFGRVAEYRPWLTGFAMVVLGCALVAITMALGG